MVYGNTGQIACGEELLKKAFDLRDRASERERLYISSQYYLVTGQIEKSIETYELFKQSYPRETSAYINLGSAYSNIGQSEKDLENLKQAARLNPDMAIVYTNQAWNYITLGRFDEAKAILDQEAQRKWGGATLHAWLAILAYNEGDSATAAREEALAGENPNWQLTFLRRSAYHSFGRGKLREGSEFLAKARELAEQRKYQERVADFWMDEAGITCIFGPCWAVCAACREGPRGFP